MTLELLSRLHASPFTARPFWADAPVLGLDAGERWVIRDRGVRAWTDELVDAEIVCAADDLSAMLRREAPAGDVVYRMGTRDIAPRKRQAHAVLALAALGWAGPWPSADADPAHVGLVREAWYDLVIGPADARQALFPGRPETLRKTDGVRRTFATEGLAEPCEIAGDDPRAVRAAALYVVETGALPPARLAVGDLDLRCAIDPRLPDGPPLPHRDAWLVRVRTHA